MIYNTIHFVFLEILHIEVEQITKTVIFRNGESGRPILVLNKTKSSKCNQLLVKLSL